MVTISRSNQLSGVPQEVAAQSSQTKSSLRSAHGYNTRLQARLSGTDAPAMNDPSIENHLDGGVEPDQDNGQELTPRITETDEAPSSSSAEDSEGPESSDSDSDSESVSKGSSWGAHFSDSELDEAENGRGKRRRISSEPTSESDSGSMDIDSDSESESASEASESGSEISDSESESESLGDEEQQMIEIDLGELLGHLINGAGASNVSLDGIRDKATFLESIDIVLPEGNDTAEGQQLEEKSEALWQKYKKSNSEQFDLILSLDRFSISELMGKIHVDNKLEGADKRRLLGQCSKLNSMIQDFKNIDTRNKAIEEAGADEGESVDDLLRMNAGQLAKGIALLKSTQSELQSAGYSLDVADLQVAMKSGLQVHQNDKNFPITFAEVVGIDEAKAELQEIVAYLKNPQNFTQLGARIPKGVLLSGPPGTGKTLLAKAVAGEAGVPFLSVSGSAFVEEYVGVGAKRVRELFQQANAHDACILFIDEVDAVGGRRNASKSGGGQEHDQTLNQLLTEMDGFSGRSGVIVMAATNRPDILDSALKRPGRFDRNIATPLPTVNGREAILQLHGKKKALAEGIDLNSIARRTAGYSGAELENLVNEAALLAGRAGKAQIDQSDLESAHDKAIMGLETPSFHMSEKNRLNTAYHESGHAIVSYLLEEHDPVYKVTIMPRGFSLGATHYLPDEDDTSISFRKLKGQLCSLMGGRVAEEILLGPDGVTTGASNDLERASSLARKMITQWGFSKSLGPVVFKGEDGSHAAVSARTAKIIDREVKEVILEAEQSAKDILTRNKSKLHAMAAALMEKETIDQDQVVDIMSMSSPTSSRSQSPVASPNSSDLLL